MSKTNEALKEFSKNIGKNICKRRKNLGWSQGKLVEKAKKRFPDWKLTQSTLSKYETGEICMTSFVFFRFCELLEVHSAELCPVNEGKKIRPYKKKECLETKKDFKISLSKHLHELIDTKTGENSTESPSICPKNNNAVSINKLHKKICEFAEKMVFVDNDNLCIEIRTIYYYFSEERIPALDCLFLICKILGIELSELIS